MHQRLEFLLGSDPDLSGVSNLQEVKHLAVAYKRKLVYGGYP